MTLSLPPESRRKLENTQMKQILSRFFTMLITEPLFYYQFSVLCFNFEIVRQITRVSMGLFTIFKAINQSELELLKWRDLIGLLNLRTLRVNKGMDESALKTPR